MGFLQDIGEDSGTLFKSHTALCLGATRRGVRVLLCLRAPPHVSLFKVLKVISSGGANRFHCSKAHLFRRRCRVESFQFFHGALMKNASFQSLSSPMTLRQRARAVKTFLTMKGIQHFCTLLLCS